MSAIWPQETIAELISTADRDGSARALLGSPEEAARFRWAIYHHRKQNKVGQDLLIVVEQCAVILSRKPAAPVIQIVNGN
jgi:hypothetical protein